MTHSPIRSLATTVALACPALLGCDAAATNSPSTRPTADRPVAAPTAASTARATALSQQQEEVVHALKRTRQPLPHRINLASGQTNVFEGVNQREIMIRVYGDNAVVTQLFTLRG